MTIEQNLNNPKIFDYLKIVAPIIPAPFYWVDARGIVLGGNDLIFDMIGSSRDLIGKTAYDVYSREIADQIIQGNQEVMRLGERLSQEEQIADITTGEIKYFTSIKAPLYDEDNVIIGIIGTSIEITAQKETEQLKIENEAQKAHLQEQKKFSKVVNQVAHDIRSPLSALLMTVKSCREIPEPQRVALREAAISITDITNNLLHQYKMQEVTTPNRTEGPEPILASAAVVQLLTEKKYQFQELPVKFDYDFTQPGHFAFINIESSAFKRMMSNLINNAVDAFDGQEGRATVKLDATEEAIKLTIQDDGKGMPSEVVNKILNRVAVTDNKQDGHGLGMMQVSDTLERFQGEIHIHSVIGRGTQVSVTFPRITAPDWIAEKIELGPEDCVIILDDDASIHNAWDTHFEAILRAEPDIQLKHFEIAEEAIDFINALSPDKKAKIFLLADYELLKQPLNGLDVIERTGISRSLLVTSHYADQSVRGQVKKTDTKILPKQMASEIPIIIDAPVHLTEVSSELKETEGIIEGNFKKVDLVLVDDNKGFVATVERYLKEVKGSKLDCYYNPHEFLKQAHVYPKDTKISIDNDFGLTEMDGLKLAGQLYKQGYKNLYMLSGKEFGTGELPDYLTFIMKTDLDKILDLL